ncbi:TadE/TadG family type IV pilus assembly protein [Azotobacter salinestris]|uniref:TadE/TadG family type IV pilus assembly protein n=1 Tax=Azotobacter salinestris TaxID=69964 RepID=UPI0032E0024B
MNHIKFAGCFIGKRRSQRGIAIVEFSIGVPVLLLLLLAVGEFGRLFFHYNILLQASRDAAGYAARHAWDDMLGRLELSRAIPGSTLSVTDAAHNLAVYGFPVVASEEDSESDRPDRILPELGLGESTIDVDEVCLPVCDHVRVTIRHTFSPLMGSALPGFFGKAVSLEIPLVATTVMRAL